MPARPHILIVNGRKVRQPVFVIGTPHSGADLLGRALKRTSGFHVTIGQPAVLGVVHAFARTPSIQRGRDDAAATVLRDALSQGWQVAAHSCLTCLPSCQLAGRAGRHGRSGCVEERQIRRYGDASPELIHSAGSLFAAFPDAKCVQIIRDGRDAVASMVSDAQELAWLRRGAATIHTEFPNPFFGIETETDRAVWPGLGPAGQCALRWRGAVRTMARLRSSLSAAQLTTIRYEQLITEPDATTGALAEFIGERIAPSPAWLPRRVPAAGAHQGARWAPGPRTGGAVGGSPETDIEATIGSWRGVLSFSQAREVQMVAGTDLIRVGYGR